MVDASTESGRPPGADLPAVERLDRAFRVVSIAIISLTILLVWSERSEPVAPQPQAISVAAQSPSEPLSKEWRWQRPDSTFDAMYRTR